MAATAFAATPSLSRRPASTSITPRISASVCVADRKKRRRGWSRGTPTWMIGGT